MKEGTKQTPEKGVCILKRAQDKSFELLSHRDSSCPCWLVTLTDGELMYERPLQCILNALILQVHTETSTKYVFHER